MLSVVPSSHCETYQDPVPSSVLARFDQPVSKTRKQKKELTSGVIAWVSSFFAAEAISSAVRVSAFVPSFPWNSEYRMEETSAVRKKGLHQDGPVEIQSSHSPISIRENVHGRQIRNIPPI